MREPEVNPRDGRLKKGSVIVSEPAAYPVYLLDGRPEKSILSCEPIAYQSDGAGIAIATANERLILLLSKNFDDEVEIRSEPKLDVSGRKIKYWPLNMNKCGILMFKWYYINFRL